MIKIGSYLTEFQKNKIVSVFWGHSVVYQLCVTLKLFVGVLHE